MVELSPREDSMRLRDRLFPDTALSLYAFASKPAVEPSGRRGWNLTDTQRLRVEAVTARETPGALARWWGDRPKGVTVTVLDLDLLPVEESKSQHPYIMLLNRRRGIR